MNLSGQRWRSTTRLALGLWGALTVIAAPGVAAAPGSSCASQSAQARSRSALTRARGRWALEGTGTVAHAELARVAQDAALLSAVGAGRYAVALAEANRQLIHHVVRIRIVRAGRVVVDANPRSFSVAGPARPLRRRHGTGLGQLSITIQDVLGFVKLVHKFTHAELLVRGLPGQVVTSLPALSSRSLPAGGCVSVAGRRYLVRSFHERSFTGAAATVWILVSA